MPVCYIPLLASVMALLVTGAFYALPDVMAARVAWLKKIRIAALRRRLARAKAQHEEMKRIEGETGAVYTTTCRELAGRIAALREALRQLGVETL